MCLPQTRNPKHLFFLFSLIVFLLSRVCLSVSSSGWSVIMAFLVILTHFTQWNFPHYQLDQSISVLRVVACCFYLRRFREMQIYYRVNSVRQSATLLGCLVCVIFNSHSFLTFKLYIMIVHTLKMCTLYFVHLS